MKHALLLAVALAVLGCGKDSKDSSNATGKAPPLSDDPKAMMAEMLDLMTELSKTAVANKGDCDKLGKAMHKRLDELMPRLEQAKAASQRLEKKWAGKSMDERMAIMSRMPQIKKMAEVGETTSTILATCDKHAEVQRFKKRLEKVIGR